VTLFTAWHAQHNEAVAVAADLLKGQRVRDMAIMWHEDVEKWHPGQRWIWQAGGFGVFDPGINAFSIASLIFPGTVIVRKAGLVFPPESDTPIAAEIGFASAAATGALTCSLDWRRTADEEWTITIVTEAGQRIELRDGGARLLVDGEPRVEREKGEYPAIYRRFAALVESGTSDIDSVPLRLVADCLLIGGRSA
jgi:hypothetical protein